MRNYFQQNWVQSTIARFCFVCILSPLLFNLYIDDLPYSFENILSDPFVLPNGTKLSSLLYADDLIILSRSEAGPTSFPGSLILPPPGANEERTLAHAGHVSYRILEMTIKLLKGLAA